MGVGGVRALLIGAAVAVGSQWWAWPADPLQAAIDGAVVVACVLTGHLLSADPAQRSNGRLVTVAGVAWGAWGLGAYGPHPLSVLDPVSPVVFIAAGATLLLRYPGERLERRAERVLVRVLTGW